MSRNKSLDSVGGIMILWMIFVLHTAKVSGIKSSGLEYALAIMTCFLPWFFFKAGMFYHPDRSLKEEIIHGWRRLIVPFLLFSFIGWFLIIFLGTLCINGGKLGTIFRDTFYSFLYYGAIRGNNALWFLLSLFMVRILFSSFRKMGIHSTGILFVFGVVVGIYHFVAPQHYIYIGNIANGVVFFSLGYLLRDIQYKNMSYYASLVIFFIQWFYPIYIDFRATEIYNGRPFIIAEIYCLAGCIFFNNLFDRYLSQTIPLLTYIGRNTMIFYLTHYIIVVGMVRFIYVLMPTMDPTKVFLLTSLVLIVSLICINRLFKLPVCRRLLGKK